MRRGLYGALFGGWGRRNRIPALGDVVPGTPPDPELDPALELEGSTDVLLLESGDRLLLE